MAIDDIKRYSIDTIKTFIAESIDNLLTTSISDRGLSKEEYEKKQVRKEKLNNAIKNCGTGDLAAKNFVKGFIMDILLKNYGINQENVDLIIPFSNPKRLTVQDKFEILLYHYKKKYEYDALEKLICENNLDSLRLEDGDIRHFIESEEIETLYEKIRPELSYEDKIEIITQRIYQEYRGLGVIDEIRDMNIEGVSGGVSGIAQGLVSAKSAYLGEQLTALPLSYNSIWIMLGGRSIHLRFLGFGSERELERICQNVYKYHKPGDLTQAKGYIKTTMADGSRVIVFRPPFAESWMFFIRKDNLKGDISLEKLLPGDHFYPLRELLKFIVKSGMNLIITGMQYTGKTTFLAALIKYIYGTYNIRVWEEFFELYLRRLYPYKNIASIQETTEVSGTDGISILKKTDGTVTIVGEASDDHIISYIISVHQAGSRFTMTSHHAKNFDTLIRAFRNATLNTGLFRDEKIAQQEVIAMMDFNLHLDMAIEGNYRYPARLTECVPSKDYTSYKAVNIFEYDVDTEALIIVNPFSNERIQEMRKRLTKKDRIEFDQYIKKYFS